MDPAHDSHSSAPYSSLTIEGHAFYWMTIATNLRNSTLSKALAPLGCTVPQWRIMNMLRQRPGISIGQLAEQTVVDRTTLTRTIDGLERNGLLIRDVRPENRRILALRLTSEGHRLYEQLVPVVSGINQQALEGLDRREVGAALETIRKIIINLGGPGSS